MIKAISFALLFVVIGAIAFAFLAPLVFHGADMRRFGATMLPSVLDEQAQRMRTTAVTETKEGVRVVSSSQNTLTPAQRAALQPGEIEGKGQGHAEVTGINAAKQAGLTPTATAASRPICPTCAKTMQQQSVQPASPLKPPNN